MKKIFAMMTIVAFLGFGMTTNVMAQDEATPVEQTEATDEAISEEAPVVEEAAIVEEAPAEQSIHQALKTKFI